MPSLDPASSPWAEQFRWGVVCRKALLAAGYSADAIAPEVARGELRRLRRGWYALPGAEDNVAAAVAHGASLTCADALSLRGCRTVGGLQLHVRIPRGRSVLLPPGLIRHVAPHRLSCPGMTPVDELRLALACAFRCLDDEALAVVADSALEQRLVDADDLRWAADGCSLDRRKAVDSFDGGSQSVTESLVRMRLRRMGIKVRSQVVIPGLGRVDLLVGDLLIIECDSKAHHTSLEAYRNDRRRDRVAVVNGYLVLRLTYADVLYGWEAAVQDILAVVRADRHRSWRPAPRLG